MGFNIGLESLDMYKMLKLYHCTNSKNYKSIREHGLRKDYYAKNYNKGLYKTIYQGVYLTSNSQHALDMLANLKLDELLLITCNVIYKNIYIDEDFISACFAFDIPTMIFQDIPVSKHPHHDRVLVETRTNLLLLDKDRLEKLRLQINSVFPRMLPSSPEQATLVLKHLNYFFIWANLKLPKKIDYTVLKDITVSDSRGVQCKLPEDLIQTMLDILPSSLYSWLSKYREEMRHLVKNSNKHLETFLELDKRYKGNSQYDFEYDLPTSFINTQNITFTNPVSKILQIDKYKVVDKTATFTETLYP